VQVGAASTSSIALLPVPVNSRRDDVAERSAAQSQQVAEVGSRQSQLQGEVTRIRVRPSAEAQQASEQAQSVLRDLPPRQRSAVQSYLDNGPTIQERLGVELAGIDEYV
jgi:hypothetical protein